jgi:hypothetical protein
MLPACSFNMCYFSWAGAGLGIFFSLWLFFMQVWGPDGMGMVGRGGLYGWVSVGLPV